MKKILLFSLLLLVSIFMLSSCKKGKDDTDTTEVTTIPLFDYMGSDLSEYIDLKGYKGIKMPKDMFELGFNYMLYTELSSHNHKEGEEEITFSEPITDRTIMFGDLVDLDYEGYIDGKLFPGGSAKSHKLFIGSKEFIDGFESSLVGRGLEGDREFSIFLKFPEKYIHDDLAGKDVEFKIKINSYVEINYPELTDDLAKHMGYKDAESYRRAVTENLKNSYAIKIISEASTFRKLPEGQVDRYIFETFEKFSYYAAALGMSLEDYTETQLGYTKQQLYELVKREAESYVKGRLIFCSIAQKEGISVTDKEYNDYIEELIESSPYLTKADIEKMYGEKYIREVIINEKAYTWLSDNVILTD